MKHSHLRLALASSLLASLAPTQALGAQSPETPPAYDIQSLSPIQGNGDEVVFPLYVESTSFTISLYPHSMRSAKSRRVSPRGSRAPVTFRGELLEEPGSRIIASVRDGELRAMILRVGSDEPIWVLPVSELGLTMPGQAHAVLSEDEIPDEWQSINCGFQDSQPPALQLGDPQYSTTTRIADVIVDADYEYFLHIGSVAAAEDRIEEAYNFVSAIYEWSIDLRLELAELTVWDDPADPFMETGTWQNARAEYKAYINSTYAREHWDLVQLFTDKNLSPTTFVGDSEGWAFCQELATAASTLRPQPSLYGRVVVVAHEHGHNLSAGHCANDPECGIMFPSAGGGPSGSSFSPATIAQFLSYSYLTDCTDPSTSSGPAPSLTAVTPTTVEIFPNAANPAMLTVTGADLSTTHQAVIGSKIQTLNAIRVVDDQMVFVTPPAADALGPVDLALRTGSGESNVLSISYVPTEPPRLSAPSQQFYEQDLTADFGGQPSVAYIVYVNDTGTTNQVGGLDLLSNPMHTQVGALDSMGLGNFAYDAPGVNVHYWIQVLTRDASGALYATDPVQVLYY